MPATLTWIDHDAEARDRMQRVLALFEESGTLDELGIGAIRDSFSDLLFPGVSTIQTRLRYFLIVPWVYGRMEGDGVASRRVEEAARAMELDVAASLLESGEEAGVFGRTAGRRLKRLPSLVYWAGLAAWGIRRFRGTRGRYHQALDVIRRRRTAAAGAEERHDRDPSLDTWDPALPAPPRQLPHLRSLELTRAEAEYLQDRVGRSCRGSLLAWLFQHPTELGGRFPWEHPAAGAFPKAIRHILRHARLFSAANHGASLLYNLLLAREGGRPERVEEYEGRLREWRERTDFAELAAWDLDGAWTVTAVSRHRISPMARRYVESWVTRAVEVDGAVADDREASRLVRRREERVKGARARFRNRRMLEQWGGVSSPGALDYRWPVVTVYGNDLHRALSR